MPTRDQHQPVLARARAAVEHLVGGLVTAVLAPAALRGVRAVADRERERLGLPAPTRPDDVLRDVGWLALHAVAGRRLLRPDLVARLTDAHTVELRRIERSLHDGTQNRLVAVNVLLGGARRALTRDPGIADAMLGRAQDAAEAALAELRAVVRGILPPVLTDRGLPDALSALAAACPVACRVDADLPGRCTTSAAASAYFVVAEALTNIARHSGARHATVVLRRRGDLLCLEITDDGRGGADERGGAGLAGMRGRVEAHDGTFTLASPVGGPTTLTASLPCGL